MLDLLCRLILQAEQRFLLRVVVFNSWSLVDDNILLRWNISILILLDPTNLNGIILIAIPIDISRSVKFLPPKAPLIFPHTTRPIPATPILAAPISPSWHNKTLIDDPIFPAIYFFQISILILIDIHLFLVGNPFGHGLVGGMDC